MWLALLLHPPYLFTDDTTPYLTEELLYEVIDECEEHSNYSRLIRTLGEVYSDMDSLSRSFLVNESSSPLDAILDKAGGEFLFVYFSWKHGILEKQHFPMKQFLLSVTERHSLHLLIGSLTGLKKEDVRSLEGEKDKDEDSSGTTRGVDSGTPNDPRSRGRRHVDLPSVRRAYSALFKLSSSIFENALVNALVTLAGNLHLRLKLRRDGDSNDDVVNVLLIVFEIPALGSGDFLETALPAICRACEKLPIELQAKLAQVWSGPGRTSLRTILENLQQLVTLRVIVTQFHPNFYVQDEDVVTSATELMKVGFRKSENDRNELFRVSPQM